MCAARRRRTRNAVKAAESLRWMRSAMTWPVATFIAAMMEMVPWRAYSNSRRASRPCRAGIRGCLRDLAWMPVFSSTLISTVPGGGFRYRRQICPARSQNAGSSARLSQPRTLCGRTLASASTRPTVAAETARPRSPRWTAIPRCDHCDSSSGGTEVAAGDVQPDAAHVIGWADPGEQRLGLARRQLAAHPAGSEPGDQPVQPAHRLGAPGRELLPPAAEQPPAHKVVITGHHQHAAA